MHWVIGYKKQIFFTLSVLGALSLLFLRINPAVQVNTEHAQHLRLPYHALFSQNTLRISQGELQQALSCAYQLKQMMSEDEAVWQHKSAGRTLYAYNLLRIASLEREVGSPKGELAAWETVLQNAGWGGRTSAVNTYDPETYHLLAQTFQNGDISLFSYIQKRSEVITLSCAGR